MWAKGFFNDHKIMHFAAFKTIVRNIQWVEALRRTSFYESKILKNLSN
jgi:hypothetical protein